MNYYPKKSTLPYLQGLAQTKNRNNTELNNTPVENGGRADSKSRNPADAMLTPNGILKSQYFDER